MAASLAAADIEGNRSIVPARKLLWSLLLLIGSAISGAQAANVVQFQGRTYVISVISPAPGVPLYSTNDLIFVQDLAGHKFLCIPSNVALRGDYDISLQRFFIIDPSTASGNIISFNRIDGTLIDLNGNFINTIVQDVTPPIDTYAKPVAISETPVDVCLVNNALAGYRTDGPTATQAKIYTITRTGSSSVTIPPTVVPFKNATSAFLTFDNINNTYLTVHAAVDKTLNVDLRRRISAFNPTTGALTDEIILDALDPALGYTGNTGGMTIDPATGTIYLLDAGSVSPTTIARKVFAFTPLLPQITSITPKSGSFAGGTQVTLTGINFPPDSAVFFGGVAATNVTVVTTSTITCTTPAHTVGTVDVTVTGTGIPTLTLTAGYSYINAPPVPALNASPTQGPAPLNVSFNIGGTTDVDDPVATRVLVFGDGNSFTFPSDLTVVNVSHNYLANGTYTAVFTATDAAGASASASVVIIVGSGGADVNDNNLVLRHLSFKIRGPNQDTVKITGECIVPDDASLAGGDVTVGFAGAQFSATIDQKGRKAINSGKSKFTIRPLKKRGFDPNTFTFTLSQSTADLRTAFTAAGIDLTKNGPQTMNVFIQLVTDLGRNILHNKLNAVVDVKSGGSGTSLTLKRR
jgi:PKD repeat protein